MSSTPVFSCSSSKGGVIQPGSIVTAFYGPFAPELDPGRKNRSRTKIRGVVLASHSENHWLIHWFLIGRNAYAPFNKVKVEEAASPISQAHVKEMLEENRQNYIGGPEQLVRNYINNVSSVSSTTKPLPKKRAVPSKLKLSKKARKEPAKSATTPKAASKSVPPPFSPKHPLVTYPQISPTVINSPRRHQLSALLEIATRKE